MNLMLELIPIKPTLEENEIFQNIPEYQESLMACIDYYKIVGYSPPWLCYNVKSGEEWVGGGGFKGAPKNNKIEIAYHTLPQFQGKGIGAGICSELVLLSLNTDPKVIITARTLPEEGPSAKILQKNGFRNAGIVVDPDDGDVWEWVYEQASNP
jgi:RimJ/RimL family protein N-acetyltransferase